MWTIIWTFIKPYLSNVFFYVIAGLVVICVVQTGRIYIKDNQIALLTVKLTAATDKLVSQDAEFKKLKALADATDLKLKEAYAENAEIAAMHEKQIKEILKSRLPATATCDDTAKWAKDIARRHK